MMRALSANPNRAMPTPSHFPDSAAHRGLATEPVWVAITTLPSLAEAQALGRDAVAAGLAACAQVDGAPITASYLWQGQCHEAQEYVLRFKTRCELGEALHDWVARRHPNEVPQWLVSEMAASPAYQCWVAASTGGASDSA